MTTYITKTNGLYGSLTLAQENQVASILAAKGVLPMSFYYYNVAAEADVALSARLDGILAALSYGDDLVLQLPTFMGAKFDQLLIQKFNVFRQSSSSKLIFFVHDDLLTDPAMTANSDLVHFIDQADVLIVNSPATAQYLADLGVSRHHYVFYHILDVPTRAYATLPAHYSPKINLIGQDSQEIADFDKAGFKVDVYGTDLEATDTVIPHSVAINDPRLPYELAANGGWGVIMPHQKDNAYRTHYDLGIMIGAGLPIVALAGTPDAEWVEHYRLGFVSRSVDEAIQQITSCVERDYLRMRLSITDLAHLTEKGTFISHAVSQAVRIK